MSEAAVPATARESLWQPSWQLDLRRTLAPLRRGGGDPCHRADASGLWRTASTPDGPATLRLEHRREGVRSWAWGPGAEWLLDGVPELLGAVDDPEAFTPRHPLLAAAQLQHPGLRLTRTRLVMEALVPAVLEQKVTGVEARRAWRWLVVRHGSPAPGPAPAGMRVAPDARGWARVPSWDWHRAGVDGKRSRAVLAATAAAVTLEATVALGRGGPTVVELLRRVPGIGAWTAAEVVQRAHGDPDHVSVGDYHLCGFVGWALAGRPFDDDEMLAELDCYAGQRQRAIRLLEVSGARKPRFGPRLTIADHRRR